MKRTLALTAFCLSLTVPPAFAQTACPWAGGEYKIKEHGISVDFTVNADCTEMTWIRVRDNPETPVLNRTKEGWKGTLDKGHVELLENGHNVRVIDASGVSRQPKAKRQN